MQIGLWLSIFRLFMTRAILIFAVTAAAVQLLTLRSFVQFSSIMASVIASTSMEAVKVSIRRWLSSECLQE